jgi:hypothetical protein
MLKADLSPEQMSLLFTRFSCYHFGAERVGAIFGIQASPHSVNFSDDIQ